ncbi:MAG: hypothetical protein AAGE52_08225 [Myxococcota bacterium]
MPRLHRHPDWRRPAWLPLAWAIAGCAGGTTPSPTVRSTEPTLRRQQPAYVTLDPDECRLGGLPATRGSSLLIATDEHPPGVLAIDWQTRLQTAALEDDVRCCETDDCPGTEVLLEVDETLRSVASIDEEPTRNRAFPEPGDLPDTRREEFAYCECGSPPRPTSRLADCPEPEAASCFFVFAEFQRSGSRYRVLVDHQWDPHSVRSPRVERRSGQTWQSVAATGLNTGEECPRHHFAGSFSAYAGQSLVVIRLGLMGPMQSDCEPGVRYELYEL